MNDASNDKPLDPPASPRRRSLSQAIALGAGATAFYGPWKTNHVWAQAPAEKPASRINPASPRSPAKTSSTRQPAP